MNKLDANTCAVITTYSFDADIVIRLYPDEKTAKAALEQDARNEYRIDTEENGWDDATRLYISSSRDRAVLTNRFPERTDVTTWRFTPNVTTVDDKAE